MEIIKCIHVTATEKKHLKEFLNSGLTDAKINRKLYSVISGKLEGEKMLYKIRITTPYLNDYGEKLYETQTVEVLK